MFLLVNFGGPRNLSEIPTFLSTLFLDEDVIRPKLFYPLHKLLFTYIARKRAKSISHDYKEIGGKSTIFEETEKLAKILEKKMKAPFVTFHRYLPETHKKTLFLIEHSNYDKIYVLPLFPQFSYSTTGSSARFFQKNLSPKSLNKLHWIKSYPSETPFVMLWQKQLRDFIHSKGISENEAFFLFSAHGLPQSYIDQGDPYEKECQLTVSKIMKAFPRISYKLSFQSQFGKEKWNEPYTKDLCSQAYKWCENKKHIIFVPISFTSDHIETLFEIEKIYMPLIKRQGLVAHRVPSCYSHPDFVNTMCSLLNNFIPVHTNVLVRN